MPKRKFDRALLDETLARDNASHDETKELPVRLNVFSRIPFTCACGTPDTQVFRRMVDNGGARCKLCTKHSKLLKMKAATFKNHGVYHPMHSAEVKERQKATTLENYGVENPSQNDEIKKKKKSTTFKNYGVENPSQNAEVRDRAKATNLEKYGAESPMHIAEVKEKVKATTLENYGVENASQSAEVKERKKVTCLENYGVENPAQSAEVMGRAKATCLEKYGVEHPSQSPEILERAQKNAFKRKDFTTPSGQVWTLQGYEPLVAPKLIDEYGENDITPDLKQVPCIWWTDSKGVRHRYYCDFYVKSHKLVVEVKSSYTVVVDADKIVATREVANALGYGYRLIVLDDKGDWTRDEFSPSILGAEGKKPVSDIGLEDSPLE